MPPVLRWYFNNVLHPPGPRWILLLLLLSMTVLGLIKGVRLIQETSFDFKAPTNSKADLAEQALSKYFPNIAGESAATTVVIQSLKGENVIDDPQVISFEMKLQELLTYDFKDALVYASYRTLKRQGLEYFADQFVNWNKLVPTAQTIRLGLSRLPYPDFRSQDFANLVDDAIRLLVSNSRLPKQDYFIASTGAAVFSRDVKDTTEKDVSFIDGATFPLAMFILALVLRSFRLLLLPVFCIISVISLSLLIMYELSERDYVKVTTLVPSIMMSSSVGFSIDYSLFLLSRFREELRNERRVEEAVLQSVCYAGHTVVVSGFTLAFCWFVLMTFPVPIVSSVGIAAGMTTTVCVLVNLSLTPCIILSFPVFFSTESSFFSLMEWATFRKKWFRRLKRLVRWIFCCGCACFTSASSSSSMLTMTGRSSGVDRVSTDLDLATGDAQDDDRETPLLSHQQDRQVRGEFPSCALPQQQLNLIPPPVMASTDSSSSATASSPSISSSSLATDDLILPPPPAPPSSSSLLPEDRPSSRPPIVFIENQAQVATEMRFVEANARRTFKVARFVTSSWEKSLVIVLSLTALLVPFAYFAWHYDHSDSFLLMIPRSAQGTRAYRVVEQEFGKGKLDPYQILIIPSWAKERKTNQTDDDELNLVHGDDDEVSILGGGGDSDDLFRFVQQSIILDVLLKENETSPLPSIASIQSVTWLFNRPVSYKEYSRCKHLLSPVSISSSCRTILAAAKQSLSKEGAVLVRVELAVEPSSGIGRTWLRKTRIALEELQQQHSDVEIHVAMGASISLDVVDSVYEQFPMAIAFTATVVLVLVACAFQSIVVPLRALFSIAATLCFVYGSAVLVYQHHVLSWTRIKGFTSPTNEIFWVSPIMLFGVLCGISLDYDTFTLTRIVEYRTAGFSDTDSVRAGLASSFKVVTTAGFIMTIAFCGLLFSDLPVLNQISFFLCTAVLFDTFVVRMLYVPSLMILLGRYNWFPRNNLAKFETES